MPEKWRSVLLPIFKEKADVQGCGNHRGIKLMSHTMKLWERAVEARLRSEVSTCEQQHGFNEKEKRTPDAIFPLRMHLEKNREAQKELHHVNVDLEKVYDRVERSCGLYEEVWSDRGVCWN